MHCNPLFNLTTEAMLITTPASSSSPSNVAVMVKPLGSVLVTWLAPVEQTSPVREYRVSYGLLNSSGPAQLLALQASALDCTLTASPSSPSNVTVMVKPLGSVLVTWLAPAEQTSPVREYMVSYSLLNSSGPAQLLALQASALGCTLTVSLAMNVIAKSPTSVLVSWTSPASLSASSYEVQYSRGLDSSSSTLNTKEQSVLLADLVPNSTYSITVTAIASGAKGSPMYLTVKTPPAPSPSRVTVSNRTASSAVVTWQPPMQDAGLVTAYRVSYSPVNSTEPSASITAPATVLGVNLTGLKDGTVYCVSVSALTSLGTEESSLPVYFSTEPLLLVVNATAKSPTSVLVSWTSPASLSASSYEVQYSRGLDSSSSTLNTKEQSVLLADLVPNSTYSITVTPIASGAKGRPGHTTVATPKAPSPSRVTVSNRTASSAVVTWQPPMQDAGLVTAYRVSYSPVNSTEPSASITAPATVLGVNLTGLKDGTVYCVSVSALTSLGTEESSLPVYFSTEPLLLVVNATAKSPTSVLVSWTSPASLSASSYEVQYSRGLDSSSSTLNTKEQSVLLADLVPNSTYSITVTPIASGAKGRPGHTTVATPKAPSPSRVTVSNRTASSAVVTWQPPMQDAGLVTAYRVSYSPVNSTEPSASITAPATVLGVNLTGLKDGTVYCVSVSALTSLGTEESSLPVYFSTEPLLLVVNATAKSPTSVLVSWTSPASLSASSYEVQYSRGLDSSSSTLNTKEQSVLLADLVPNSTYSITVTPIASGAKGRPGHTTVATPKAPSPSRVTVSNRTASSAVVTWQPPMQDAGLVTAYRVSYSPVNSTEPSASITAPATVLGVNLTGLKDGTVYCVSVSALTSLGTEESSLPVYFSTEPLLLVVNATAKSPTSVLVSWTSPASLSASSYEVQYSRGLDSSSSTLNTKEQSVLLADLVPNSTYSITVTPIASGAKGRPGHTTVATPKETVKKDLPSPPLELQAFVVGTGTAFASWMLPAVSTGDILHYNLYVQQGSSPQRIYPTENTFIYINDLSPSLPYDITVTAVNQNGEGLPSNNVQLKIEAPPLSDAVAAFKPKLLTNEDLSIRSSSILLKEPDCGVFEKAADHMNTKFNKNLTVALVVAESKVIKTGFRLASSSFANLTYNQTRIGSLSPYVSLFNLSAYDCYEKKTLVQRETQRSALARSEQDNGVEIRVNIVGSNRKCYSASQLCNGPLQPETGYRTKYILVDESGTEVMSSNWSDTFKTKKPIPYQAIEPWDAMRSAGMIVAIVLVALLFLFLLLLCLFCFICCRKRSRKMYKQAKGYDTHYTRDMVRDSVTLPPGVRVHREAPQANTPYFIQTETQHFNNSPSPPQLQRNNSFYAFLETIKNRFEYNNQAAMNVQGFTMENVSSNRAPDSRILEAISRSSTHGIQHSKPRSRSVSDFLESAKRSGTITRQEKCPAGSTQIIGVSRLVSHNSPSQESYSVVHRQTVSSYGSEHTESAAGPV
ncbi:fibronectin-like [Amia ocellicauda]|uniref:fibronectin-like n=1 Tax=Amia ocellicauda TaxID=2972642 RepID=UPI003463DAFE